MSKIICPDCGQSVLYLRNHGCTGVKEAKLKAPIDKAKQPSKPLPPPKATPSRVHEPKAVPLTSGDDGIIPLTTDDVTERPKWKGPLSTERVKKHRELNREHWQETHAAYMRHYRKHGPKHGV